MLADSLRMLLVAYLLTLSVGSLLGSGSVILLAPPRALYAATRVVLTLLSLGKVRMQPLTDLSSKRIGGLREALEDRIEQRRGERMYNEELDAGAGDWERRPIASASEIGPQEGQFTSTPSTPSRSGNEFHSVQEGDAEEVPELEPLDS